MTPACAVQRFVFTDPLTPPAQPVDEFTLNSLYAPRIMLRCRCTKPQCLAMCMQLPNAVAALAVKLHVAVCQHLD